MMAKKKLSLFVISTFFVSLVAGTSAQSNNTNTKSNPDQVSELTMMMQRLEAIEKKNHELEKSLKEQLRWSKKKCDEQFKTLRKELDELKSENCVGEDVWLLRPPIRGRRGQDGRAGAKGEKGSAGQNGNPGQKGERGATGRTGVKGQGFPDPESVTSCSAAMTLLPFAPRRLSIYPHEDDPSRRVEVLCDFDVDGGGWTIIQKRTSGPKEEFNRTWDEYAEGFGSVGGNFWLGLENIHALTKNGDQELRIDLEDFNGNKAYAKYSRFSISDASDFYRLSIGGYYGDSPAGDSMTGSWNINGAKFSTKDKDNDDGDRNCAVDRKGAWWYKNVEGHCAHSNLNGYYRQPEDSFPGWGQGLVWESWRGPTGPLKKVQMKIRKRN